MQLSHLSAVAMAMSLACSTKLKTMADKFSVSEYSMMYEDRLSKEMRAPLIVLGVIVNVIEVGKPQRSPGDPRIATQKTIISIRVENIVRGRVEEDLLDVVFFAYSRTNERELGRVTFAPKTGQRRLFFLWTDGAAYRTIGDVTDYTLLVRSGPFRSDNCTGKGAGCCIAEIVLRPPLDEQLYGFVKDLPESTYAAAFLCSPQDAREKLEGLAQHRDERVAASAKDMILMLKQWFP